MPRLVTLLLPCLLLSGCFVKAGDGLEVPVEEIYFPTGLALDASSEHLIVVSSDFDLQYNAGSIQSFRLDGVYDQLPVRCATDADCGGGVCDAGLCAAAVGESPCPQGDRRPADQLLYPGRCNIIDPKRPESLLQDSVQIGAFATDAVIRSRPPNADGTPSSGAQRLYVPVRGDTTLHWFDVEDGRLECGQHSNDGACDRKHRAGQNPERENTRDLSLGPEPFAIDANQDGSTIVVTNQTTGAASLFVNNWTTPDEGPELKFALRSSSIPSRPVGIVSLPRQPGAEASPTPDAFLMTFRNSAQIRLLRYASDGGSTDSRPYLIDGGGVGVEANSVGIDQRGLAIDATAREQATARCAGDEACVQNAALTPLDVYVASRFPASLLIGRTQPPLEYPYFYQTLPLTVGPSRVTVGKVLTPSGEEEVRVFVACFDSRRVFVYDPKRTRIEAEILTGRGPQAMAVDTGRKLLYVGHFTDSYVGVFSLDYGSPATFGTLLGSLGHPKAPRSSK